LHTIEPCTFVDVHNGYQKIITQWRYHYSTFTQWRQTWRETHPKWHSTRPTYAHQNMST